MSRIPQLLIPASAFLAIAFSPLPPASGRGKMFAGDAPLPQTEVMRWFNSSLRQVQSGNEVTELVDGPEALKSISEAMKTTRGPLSVLASFGPAPADPKYPKGVGTLVEGLDGNMYTTAEQGGANGRGAVCKITLDGKITTIYSFDNVHGAGPQGGLTRGPDGSFYGTTYGGGKYGVGTIFKVTASGDLTTLWDFRNGAIVPPLPYPKQPTEQQKLDAGGSYPVSPPVFGKDGNLYGVTSYANNQQYGVVYRIGAGGGYTGLYMFKPAEVATMGTLGSSLSPGTDGNLYGTTVKGGLGFGTVIKVTTGGAVSCFHKFALSEGQGAFSIIQAKDGNLYGTLSAGGASNAGVIYKLTPSGDYSELHAFKLSDGLNPIGGLLEAKDGWLYGMTRLGGAYGRGAYYKIRPSDKTFAVVHALDGSMTEGRYCIAAPIQHSNGKFYGQCTEGGANFTGSIYCVDPKRTDFIYTVNWWMTDTFPLYGPNTPSVTTLFNTANNRGVQIRSMLWDQGAPHPLQNNDEVAHINAFDNGGAILDNRTLTAGSHHQKIVAVFGPDGLTTFCGGVDFNPDRVAATSPGAPLHDVHCRVKGPAAGELLNIIAARWNDHPSHKDIDDKRGPLPGVPVVTPSPIPGATNWVQVGRTFGNTTKYPNSDVKPPYAFAPNGEQTAAKMILYAISKARKFIYIEDQYFVDTTDPKKPGGLSVRTALMAKLTEPDFQHLTVLIPHGSISDLPQVNYRRQQLINALRKAGGSKVRVFYRNPRESHSYIHAKTWIFDDQFAIIGSANTNRRSWTHDSEVMIGICDQGKPDGSAYLLPHRLRMRLWAEHLNLGTYDRTGALTGYEDKLLDGVKSASFWLTPPPGAHVLPYNENLDIEKITTDTSWDNVVDPDGS